MTPSTRTPQQRDRRFARARRLTQTLLLGSGLLSALLVTYLAGIPKPVSAVPTTVPSTSLSTSDDSESTTTVPPTTTSPQSSSGTSGSATTPPTTTATKYVPPTAVPPTTTTTVCNTTPSGVTSCY